MKNKNDIINEKLEATANEVANKYGFETGEDLVNNITHNLTNEDVVKSADATRAAGDLISKLSLVLYQQTIYDNLGTSSVYRWVNKFEKDNLPFGNSRQLGQTVLTGAGVYDANAWVPQNSTDPQYNDTFYIKFLKDDGRTLATNSYKYKKSLTLQQHNWTYYFTSGKLSELISKIRSEMSETFELFVAQQYQKIIKNLASGTAQVTIANAGENGSNLKLKKITSTATDTFQAMLDLLKELTNITEDVNQFTIASDSTNIRPVRIDNLVIFIPKALKAKFRSGILSRLPSSGEFAYDKIFSENNTFVSGLELSEIMTANNGNTTAITVTQNTFLDDNTIVVLEKDALIHTFVIKQLESQYYGENLNTQLTQHSWGNFAVNPFKRGFVFKCTNLLTDPNNP